MKNSPLYNKTVLVLGEDTRSFLSVIRSLGKAGMQVDVVGFANNSPALASRYIRNAYMINYQAYSAEEWQTEVEKILCHQLYDLVIPCDERAMYPLFNLQEKLDIPTCFAIPDTHQTAPLFDKVATRELAQSLGINVAQGKEVNLTEVASSDIIKTFGLPVVLKPAKSYESDKLNQRNSVVIARSEADISAFAVHSPECLIEQYFTGYGMGVSILSANGKISAAFAHKRVAEPEKGGGSSYRRAVPLYPDMLDACQRYCLALQYTGVAMFEFKYNEQTQDWILIEVNARFWGSLPLAIFAGVDFPALLAQHLLTPERTFKLKYNSAAHARSLSADIYDIKSEWDALQAQGKSVAIKATLSRLLGFTRLLTFQDTIDSFAWDDLGPFKAELNALLPDRVHAKINRRLTLENRLNQAIKLINAIALEEIIVLCYGNIMRSPFGELYLRPLLKKKGLGHIKISSMGLHQHENRTSPERCVQCAKTWQVDLSQHRSQWLKQHHICKDTQLILYFDLKQAYLLESYYRDYNAINLAWFVTAPLGPLSEIADPYDADDAYLHACYRMITNAIDNFADYCRDAQRKS